MGEGRPQPAACIPVATREILRTGFPPGDWHPQMLVGSLAGHDPDSTQLRLAPARSTEELVRGG